jgi:S-DNA-T family DNA segregation ATPase FtsK/SpoIIIE
MKKIDPKFEEAARLVVSTGRASTSYLQTQMGMGFARSARVMSQLEAAGIVGPQNSSKNREVLVENFSELDEIISKYL